MDDFRIAHKLPGQPATGLTTMEECSTYRTAAERYVHTYMGDDPVDGTLLVIINSENTVWVLPVHVTRKVQIGSEEALGVAEEVDA